MIIFTDIKNVFPELIFLIWSPASFIFDSVLFRKFDFETFSNDLLHKVTAWLCCWFYFLVNKNT